MGDRAPASVYVKGHRVQSLQQIIAPTALRHRGPSPPMTRWTRLSVWIAQSLFRRLTGRWQIIWSDRGTDQNIAISRSPLLMYTYYSKRMCSLFFYGTQVHSPMTPSHRKKAALTSKYRGSTENGSFRARAEPEIWLEKSEHWLSASFEIEWVGELRRVLWARSRAGEARRSEPLTATAGPYNRLRLNAALCCIRPWKQKPVDAEPTV